MGTRRSSALAAGLGLLIGACTANDPTESTDTLAFGTDTTTTSTVTDDTAPVSFPTLEVFGDDDVKGDVGRCSVVDRDHIDVELTNSADVMVDYALSIAFFDANGDPVLERRHDIDRVRPREEVFEHVISASNPGPGCQTVAIERTPVVDSGEPLTLFSVCVVSDPDFLGHATAQVAVAEAGQSDLDLTVYVTFVDADGRRRGEGLGDSFASNRGESVAIEILSSVPAASAESCEVTYVNVQ